MDLSGKRILVTGGAGFIGSNLVESLIASGHEVIALDDFSSGKEENLSAVRQSGKLHLIKGSVLDSILVRKLVREADIIFHLAAQCLRFDRPMYVHGVNATGTLNCLEAVKELCTNTGSRRVSRFILVSTSEVYGSLKSESEANGQVFEPVTIYGASKLAAELYTQSYHATWGLPTVILRLSNTYGYREHHEGATGEVIPRFAVRILNNLPPVIFGDGLQFRDFLFVSDAVEAIIKAGCTDSLIGQSVNVGSGQKVTIKEIAALMLELTGKNALGVEFKPAHHGDWQCQIADTEKLMQAIGFHPKVNLTQGLKLYLDWLAQKSDLQQLLREMNPDYLSSMQALIR